MVKERNRKKFLNKSKSTPVPDTLNRHLYF
jgi:hypothetical protein